MVKYVSEFVDTAAPRFRRKKKVAKPVRVMRSPEEWRQLVDEAKKKEGFWIKGILPGTAMDPEDESGDM